MISTNDPLFSLHELAEPIGPLSNRQMDETILSFCLMSERHIRGALTADEHFRQAGFEPLLCP
ncbi:MAG: hypothetical protein KJ072_07510 [Verrucomicrobia bacterium]|nr:hypothetical protein [Verrucomicrobiota bacterium]